MKKVKLFLLAAITSIFFIGCEKNKLPSPEGEMINQTFGINIINDNIGDKSWDYNTWEWIYNPNPYNLVFTPVGGGSEIIHQVTIDDLRNGISLQLLKGDYTVNFETIDILSDNVWYRNGNGDDAFILTNPGTGLKPWLSEYIDIIINNQNVTVNGNPVILNAVINDLMIVVDVNGVDGVSLTNMYFSDDNPRLIKEGDGVYHWGYFQMRAQERGTYPGVSGLRLGFIVDGVEKIIDAKNWELGKVYHIQSQYGNGNIEGINIPGFETINIFID